MEKSGKEGMEGMVTILQKVRGGGFFTSASVKAHRHSDRTPNQRSNYATCPSLSLDSPRMWGGEWGGRGIDIGAEQSASHRASYKPQRVYLPQESDVPLPMRC